MDLNRSAGRHQTNTRMRVWRRWTVIQGMRKRRAVQMHGIYGRVQGTGGCLISTYDIAAAVRW